MKGCSFIGVTKEIRKKTGKNPGDEIKVTLKKDEKERTVEIPGDFTEMLQAEPNALAFYETLSYTNQKNFVQWITSAKTAATRNKRMLASVQMLRDKNIKK